MPAALDIRLLILDVDGVLTDGKLYLGPDGQEWRSSHVRDGLGLKKLARAGIRPAIISGRGPGGLDQRYAALGVEDRHWRCEDKWPATEALLHKYELQPAQVAVMGDDEPDLALMQRVGLGLCPADAVPAVREYCRYVSALGGGQGAVRDAAEWLLGQCA